jgi:hypothetical protein
MRLVRHSLLVVLLSFLVFLGPAGPGCEPLLGGLGGSAEIPTVALSQGKAVLVQPPSLYALALYFCGELLDPTACLLFGPPPTKESLQFRFQLDFEVSNPSAFYIPTTEALVGLHLFPGQTYGELGAVCVTLCNPGVAGCPILPSQACVEKVTDIDSVTEFIAGAVAGVLTMAVESANGKPIAQDLAPFTVAAHDKLSFKVTFAIGIDPMLKLVQNVGGDVLTQVLGSSGKSLDIPYAVGGRVWFDVPYLGRVSTGFGPHGMPPGAPLVWNVF